MHLPKSDSNFKIKKPMVGKRGFTTSKKVTEKIADVAKYVPISVDDAKGKAFKAVGGGILDKAGLGKYTKYIPTSIPDAGVKTMTWVLDEIVNKATGKDHGVAGWAKEGITNYINDATGKKDPEKIEKFIKENTVGLSDKTLAKLKASGQFDHMFLPNGPPVKHDEEKARQAVESNKAFNLAIQKQESDRIKHLAGRK